MPGKELCWRVPEDMPLKNEKWALVPCKEHLYLVEILRKEWVEDNIAEQYRRVYAIGSTREELKPPIGRVHLIDADRIDRRSHLRDGTYRRGRRRKGLRERRRGGRAHPHRRTRDIRDLKLARLNVKGPVHLPADGPSCTCGLQSGSYDA